MNKQPRAVTHVNAIEMKAVQNPRSPARAKRRAKLGHPQHTRDVPVSKVVLALSASVIEKLRSLSPHAQAASRRPTDYRQRSGANQWDIDRRLGILDWDGS